jgi:WD40 repeat protein
MPDVKITRSVKTYSVEDGEKRGPLTMTRLQFHPTTRYLLAQCVDRRLAVWDLDAAPQKGKKGEAVVGSLVCPHDAGWIRGFAVHPRGEAVATGGSDRHLKLWQWEAGKPSAVPAADVTAHAGWVEAVAFAPDGQRIATVGADRTVKLWDAASLKLLRSAPAHANYPRDATFTPDGRWLVTAGEDGVALVWNADTLEVVRRIDTGMTSDQQGQNPAPGGILRLDISHEGRWLALSGERQTLLYELATGHGVGMLSQTGGDVAFAHGKNLLGAGENTLRLWNYEPSRFSPRSAEPRADPRGKKQPVSLPALAATEFVQIKRGDFSFGLAFAVDDQLLAVGKTDGSAELWTLS